MERYDYREAVFNDVKEAIKERYTTEELKEALQDRESLENTLYDDLFCVDGVTGNASGSYTFNSYKAEENLCHNMDLLQEALQEFGCGVDYLSRGAEACDVTIRCYLLMCEICNVLDELEEQLQG